MADALVRLAVSADARLWLRRRCRPTPPGVTWNEVLASCDVLYQTASLLQNRPLPAFLPPPRGRGVVVGRAARRRAGHLPPRRPSQPRLGERRRRRAGLDGVWLRRDRGHHGPCGAPVAPPAAGAGPRHRGRDRLRDDGGA